MRILFVADTQIDNTDLIGIRKKLSAQIKGLGNLGKVTVVMRDSSPYLFRGGLLMEKLTFWFRLYLKYRHDRYDVVYVRDVTVISGIFEALFFLTQWRALRIVEIPTYPLASNNLRGLSSIAYLFNQLTRNIGWRYFIDEVVYNGNFTNSIFGVRAERVNHFVGLEELKLSSPKLKSEPPVFIFVSSLKRYHGIDRVLRSFTASSVSGKLIIVGGNDAQLADLQNQYNDERIEFFPFLEGKELDQIFERATIGLSAMSLYKIGIEMTSGLKVAEYAARGLHVVISYEDVVLKHKGFCFNVQNDSSLIPFDQIVAWYSESNYSPHQIRNEILLETSWIKHIESRIYQLLP